MLLDHAQRLAQRLDASYTEDLVRLHRAAGGTPAGIPVLQVPRAEHAPSARIAVIVHAFYPELLGQLRVGLGALPPGADLFVSVPSETAREQAIAELSRLDLGRLDVRVVANRGRDIAPKYVTFADVYGLGHDLLLFLHTKKSLTADFGDDWRDQLFRSLVGSPEVVNGIIGLFASNPRLGVVAPRHHHAIGQTTGWDGNYPEARRLSRRTGLPVHRWVAPDFPSGSMFWARPRALADLTGLGLDLEEFPLESGQVGVTIMHALERLVFVAAAHAGFRSVMVTDPDGPHTATPAAPDGLPLPSSTPSTGARPPVRRFVHAAVSTGARTAMTAGRRLVAGVLMGTRNRAAALSNRASTRSAQRP